MIKNQKGFSLIEILVVVALSSVVVLGNSLFMSDFIKRMEQYSKESSEESELAVLNIMALNILKKSSLSFNRLMINDDNGRNFFDFYPDMPFSSFSHEDRQYTLDSTSKYFYILSSDEGKFSSTVFDPVHAYNAFDPSPIDAMTDGTTAYRKINSIPDFTNEAGAKSSTKMMSQIFGPRWADNKVFVVTCPTYLRPVAAGTAAVTLTTPPRMPTFVGKVAGDDLALLSASESLVSTNNTHPVTGAAYGNLDDYFRTLPTVGGAAPFVKVEPAQMSRFELRASVGNPGFFDLYLLNWTAAGYAEPLQVALKVKTVTFKRKSITLPIISMEIRKK